MNYATYAKVSLVLSTRSIYSFSSNVSIAYKIKEVKEVKHTSQITTNSPNTNFFDVRNLWGESLRNLGYHFLNEWLIFHRLPGFHDSNKRLLLTNSKLNSVYSPHYGRLYDIFPVFINSLQYIS